MRSSCRRLTIILSLMLILLPALLLGCSSPSEPIQVELSFSEPPVLNKPVNLTATYMLFADAKGTLNAKAYIILPEGLEKVDGDLELSDEFIPGKTYTINAVVKSVQIGTWKIMAQADVQGPGGYRELYAIVTETGAEISDRPPSGPSQSPVQTNPPSGYPNPSQSPATPISNETMPNFNFEQSIKGLSGTPE